MPFALQDDTAVWSHSSNAADLLDKGSVVFEAIIQARVSGAPGWWQSPTHLPGQSNKFLVPITFVLKGAVVVEHGQLGSFIPTIEDGVVLGSTLNPHHLKFVDGIQGAEIQDELERREQLETLEIDEEDG